jgi:hypothetical protein
MSTFVWLDYSERERRKMLDVVDLFREHDTRDELGIGSVRDGFPSFSSRLFIVQGKVIFLALSRSHFTPDFQGEFAQPCA